MPISQNKESNTSSWFRFQANNDLSTVNADAWLAVFMGLSILCHLLPWHAPVGKSFLVNALAFVCVGFGLGGYFILAKIKYLTLSVYTWFLLGLLLFIQPFFLYIRYPDGLIFPITSLLVAGLLGLAGSNIVDKTIFLQRLFYAVYLVCIITFIIQVMQILDVNIMLGYLEITLKSENGRLYANFMQPNHTAYAFIFGICGVLYQLHILNMSAEAKKTAGMKHSINNIILILMLFIFSIGVALTQSRAGLVMLLFIPVIYFISQPIAIQQKIKTITGSVVGLLVIHTLTSWFYNHFIIVVSSESLGAISRMASAGVGNRLNLSQRALMMFQDNPVFGVGWNNYMEASLAYAANFDWPEIADHSHNVVTMVLAELGFVGFLCLLPLIWLLIRAVHFKHSPQSAVALSFIGVTVIYMMVEFPLWYFRYLAVFALFLGLIEQRYLKAPRLFNLKSVKNTIAVLMIVLSFIAEYYIWQFSNRHYLDYIKFYYLDLGASGDNKLEKGDEIFGLTNYHEMIMATQTPIDGNDNEFKQELFRKAIGSFSSQYYLTAYAKILAYGNEKEQALYYFKTTCLMGKTRAGGCEDVREDLQELSKQEPDIFMDIYEDYEAWRLSNLDKTGSLSELERSGS